MQGNKYTQWSLRIASIDKLTRRRKTLKWTGRLLHSIVHFLPFVQGRMKIKGKPEELKNLAKPSPAAASQHGNWSRSRKQMQEWLQEKKLLLMR